VADRTYVGYTVDFPHRIRQHNGEITGGAKKTHKWRPWVPVCLIRGFYESSSALRFEFRLQHPSYRTNKQKYRRKRKPAGQDAIAFALQTLINLINSGDGSMEKDNKMPWPHLQIIWYYPQYSIQHPNVSNFYAMWNNS
ncbi:Hypothetical protein HVR_LOCUS6, partial [uncultured virus]